MNDMTFFGIFIEHKAFGMNFIQTHFPMHRAIELHPSIVKEIRIPEGRIYGAGLAITMTSSCYFSDRMENCLRSCIYQNFTVKPQKEIRYVFWQLNEREFKI